MTIPEAHFNPGVTTRGGIWAGSQPDKALAIFAVADDIHAWAFRAWADENKIPFKAVVGHYKGVTEVAFVIPQANLDDCARWYAGQESVLLLGKPEKGRRTAILWYVATGKHELAGRWQFTGREYALQQDGWTYDPETDAHYTIEKE